MTSALIKVTPSPSGNPRAVPLLNFGICGLGIVTALVAVAWLCKRGSYVVFLMVENPLMIKMMVTNALMKVM